MTYKRILITGGTGFLGQHLIFLLRKKYPSSLITVIDLKVNPYPVHDVKKINDVTVMFPVNICLDPLDEYFKQTDLVYHLAGLVSFSKKDRKPLFLVNEQGSKRVFEACLKNRVKKVVHISSVAGIGYLDRVDHLADENISFPWAGIKDKYYMLSKHASEKMALSFFKKGLDVTIANPGLMYGPGDYFNSVTLIRNIKKRKLPFLLPGGTNVVDVRDVARGLVMMEKGKPGERYILGGENLTFRQITDTIITILKIKNYTVPVLSHRYRTILVPLISFLETVLPIRLPVTKDLVDSGFKFRYFTSAKAQNELGFKPRFSFSKTIADTIKYLKGYDLL
ncbi:MAG: NAD-dependent epimerase/dehydratase family protein [Spirochaetes bacterium]|nr:NAD-dependent epimerase/dehydratase family protein [Spirochaetota bacterium]